MLAVGIEIALPPDVLDGLIAVHAPVFFLHHDEKYFPTNVEWFLGKSQLIHGELGVLLEKGQVTQAALLEQQAKHGHAHLYLDIERRDYCGPDPAHVDDVPVYAHAKLICSQDGSTVEALEIVYMTFYAYNGEYPLMGFTALKAGHHVGDWEHLTVRLEAPAWDLHGVWYNSHRNIEGEWCSADAVPRDPASHRIAAYVARAGHGVYPRVGRVLRLFCVANDFTSTHGLVWRPTRVVRMCAEHGRVPSRVTTRGCCLPPLSHGPAGRAVFPTQLPLVEEDSSPWQLYKGDWGTSASPSQQCWFYRPEPPVSRTHWERLVLVCARGVEQLPSKARAAAAAVSIAASSHVHLHEHHHLHAHACAQQGPVQAELFQSQPGQLHPGMSTRQEKQQQQDQQQLEVRTDVGMSVQQARQQGQQQQQDQAQGQRKPQPAAQPARDRRLGHLGMLRWARGQV